MLLVNLLEADDDVGSLASNGRKVRRSIPCEGQHSLRLDCHDLHSFTASATRYSVEIKEHLITSARLKFYIALRGEESLGSFFRGPCFPYLVNIRRNNHL